MKEGPPYRHKYLSVTSVDSANRFLSVFVFQKCASFAESIWSAKDGKFYYGTVRIKYLSELFFGHVFGNLWKRRRT